MVKPKRLASGLVLCAILAPLSACKMFSPDNQDTKKTSAPGPQGSADTAGTSNTTDPGTIEALIAKSAFLRTSDFTALSALRKAKESDVTDDINGEGAFFLTAPKALQDNSPNDCHDKTLGAAKVSTSKTMVWVDYSGSLPACREDADGVTKNYRVRALYALECRDQDMTAYKGRSTESLADIKCSNGGKTYSAVSIQAVSSATSGSVTTTSDYKLLHLYQGPDGKPCETSKSGATYRNGTCFIYFGGTSDVTVTGAPDMGVDLPKGNYRKFDITGLTYKNINDKYYTSGTLQFVLDNITGKMTYTDANTAPRWEAKIAGSAKNLTGTFSAK